jgi:hypothetical protein
MIDQATARHRAVEYLRDELAADFEETCAILDEQTADEGWCWVFFWNSRRYRETRSHRDAIPGNAPVVVVKETGRVHLTGTAFPVEDYLAEIQARP